MTEHIVDLREGQNSDGFYRYPYEEMKDHSLSVLFEGEKQCRLINFLTLFLACFVFVYNYVHSYVYSYILNF